MMFDPTLYLYLDCETRSRLDTKKSGLDLYARNCEVLILCYVLGDGDVRTWLPLTQSIPDDLELYLRRPEIRKVAWRAEFERTVMQHALGITVPAGQFVDPAAMARYASLPSGLAAAGKVLKLDLSGEIKDKEGKKLIDVFSKMGKRGYRVPEQEPEKFLRFIEYCKQDVRSERAILKKLCAFELPAFEQRILSLDQKINDTGIPVDTQFVQNGILFTERERERLLNEMKAITGLENPNSNKQLLDWLKAQGYPFKSLGKEFVKRALVTKEGRVEVTKRNVTPTE